MKFGSRTEDAPGEGRARTRPTAPVSASLAGPGARRAPTILGLMAEPAESTEAPRPFRIWTSTSLDTIPADVQGRGHHASATAGPAVASLVRGRRCFVAPGSTKDSRRQGRHESERQMRGNAPRPRSACQGVAEHPTGHR